MSRVILRYWKKDQVQFHYLCEFPAVWLSLIDLHYSGFWLWFCAFFFSSNTFNKSSTFHPSYLFPGTVENVVGNNAPASLASVKIKDIFIEHRIAFISYSNYISFVKISTTFLLPFIQSTFKNTILEGLNL